MKDKDVLNVINKIFNAVFEKDNPYTLTEILEIFAFDMNLPKEVRDSITGETTWADSINGGKFIKNDNLSKKDDWMIERKNINSLKDIINTWEKINYRTTERVYDSINVSKSDTIYRCENVYRSTDTSDSKNMIYTDSCLNSEYMLASKRSNTCSYCIRCDDSKSCSNSYNVICSNKIINGMFIEDSYDLYECIFCSHISSKKYCIANMQFEKDEYYEIKKLIVDWILNAKYTK